MKVLYVATYYTKNYVRQNVVRDALRHISEITYVECIYNARWPHRYVVLLLKFLCTSKRDVDVIILGFRAHEIFPLLRLLTRKPIITDAFISLYDTLCYDRKRFPPQSIIGRLAFWIDRYMCAKSEKIILDTEAHSEYFSQTFNIPREKFTRVFVGADTTFFYPQPRETHAHFEVFYYGTYLPLHGIKYIVQAAELLRTNRDIHFTLVGRGPVKQDIEEFVQAHNLTNVTLVPWLTLQQLAEYIAAADVCLGGHFSTIAKAGRVISGKTFQFLAMQKAVIVGDSPANAELLDNNENCVMVSTGNATQLAHAIQLLYDDPERRRRIAHAGREAFLRADQSITVALRRCIYSIKNT